MQAVVLIATKNRPEQLNVALKSVFHQTCLPKRVIVISDCDADYVEATKTVVKNYQNYDISCQYLENERTKNLSGAINTGLQELITSGILPEKHYCALLDDDDMWNPTYLAECLQYGEVNNADWIISGLIRHETPGDSGVKLSIPDQLSASDFFTGNPHIQGSNLFVKLSTLLEAGGFDENLNSTTDRDVCIRLLDLGYPRIAYLSKYLVHHYAHNDPTRLSFPSSPKKIQGLTAFFHKYVSRMRDDERTEFLDRAEKLFECHIEDEVDGVSINIKREINDTNHILPANLPAFLIGFTATRLTSTKHLLDDLCRFFGHETIFWKVIICDNSHSEKMLRELTELPEYQQLNCVVYGKKEIDEKCDAGIFGTYLINTETRKGISAGRTILHHYLYNEAKYLPGAAIWILDDDIRLDYLTTDNEIVPLKFSDVSNTIQSLKANGISIAIGKITGDAPIPAHCTLRTQLVDICADIQRRINTYSPEDSSSFEKFVDAFPDYYYDYSTAHTNHLESPCTALLSKMSERELLSQIPKIGFGKNISRPVVVHDQHQGPYNISPSILPRGGNTLVLNPECLRDFPNISPRIDGINSRRGDTFWSIENSRIGAKRVGIFPHAVRQERTSETTRIYNFDVLVADFYGGAFIRSMDGYYAGQIERTGDFPRRIRLEIQKDDIQTICHDVEERVFKRIQLFSMNAYRTAGLLKELIGLISGSNYSKYKETEVVLKFLHETLLQYSAENIQEWIQQRIDAKSTELKDFLEKYHDYVKSYRHSLLRDVTGEQIEHAKKVTTRILQKQNKLKKQLRFVGNGLEGAVFADDNVVYKYFFTSYANFPEGSLSLLKSHVLNNPVLAHTSRLSEIIEDEGEVIFVSSYEGDAAYDGGHLSDILKILREFKNSGIGCDNFHPKNLLYNGVSLKYVDLGSSLIPFSKIEYVQMCKRAYLTYRWHFREDLSEIMAASLFDDRIPELYGFEYFMSALEIKTKNTLINKDIIQHVLAFHPKNVLDYGCGRGSITESLAKYGIRVTGYDPDEATIRKNLAVNETSSIYIGNTGLSELKKCQTKFDCVVCNLVLCTIANNSEVTEVISNIRQLISETGELVVGICNPFSSFVIESESHVKQNHSAETAYQTQFVYQKKMKETNKIRQECHRPFSWYKSLFYREGFNIKEIQETNTTDVNLLTPSSDFMILTLTPIPIPNEDSVSLLIRASPREWETIDMQIRHIVTQLEGPQKFLEKIVITDSGTADAARAYSAPNQTIFNEKLSVLINEGIIDRVVCAPDDSQLIQSYYQRWFNQDSVDPKSENLQPVFMSIYGFEQCRGRHILALDSDAVFIRKNRAHDYLGEMLKVLKGDNNAVTLSFNIAKKQDEPHTAHNADGKKWRTEVRCALIDKERLFGLLPLPNFVNPVNGKLTLPWHRALDQKLLEKKCMAQSYRGGGSDTFYIHVPNGIKTDVNLWYNILIQAERGWIPDTQYGNVELTPSSTDWLPKLSDDCILLIRGRNVSVSKFRRCLDSVQKQNLHHVGILFIDAGSTTPIPEYVREIVLRRYGRHAVALFNWKPLSAMENYYIAIAEMCNNPNSIIITLDMDDALIGNDVISTIRKYYSKGADLTVGSMIRTDKICDYPADFAGARYKRGGNVWQHVRTFRKYLFDSVPKSYFIIDNSWIQYADDWAFMLPMTEIAKNPKYVKKKCYFYEPTGSKSSETRAYRESIIKGIVEKPELKKGEGKTYA